VTLAGEKTTAVGAYEAARTDAVFFALDRALLVASGPQRQKFLHGMLSNDVLGRTAGQGSRAALMDVKGHLLALLRVLVGENEVVLELPRAHRDDVHRLLEHYRVAAPVRFAVNDDRVIGLAGPRVVERLRALDPAVTALTPESHQRVTIGDTAVRLSRAGDLPADGHVLHVPADRESAATEALSHAGFVHCDDETLDALRIEDGRPWYDRDVSSKNLLHETGLVAEYHSPTKGCYVGQEVIARLEARGANVNQRLRGLRLSAARPAGAPLRADGKDVGVITTAASSPHLGAIAMGYVHRAHAEPGTVLESDGVRVEVASLPLAAEARA
jgi:aminomethyltransferase